MAEKTSTPQDMALTETVFVKIELNQKTGQMGVTSNCQNQVLQLGMISMASALIAKPKESPIMKPGFMDRLRMSTDKAKA